MAAPQVAALSAYLWSLAPGLAPADVIARLRRTAVPGVALTDPRCSTVALATAPAIDAYAAVLAADVSLSAPLVRRTLLDVVAINGVTVPNGVFDEHDVDHLLSEIDGRAGVVFDYSRYDLNGDGRTGGSTTARLDLDANPLPAWTSVTQDIDGASVAFNETALTDVDVLCYYAWSPIYTGSAAARTAALASRCRPASGARLSDHRVGFNIRTVTTIRQEARFDRPNPLTDMTTPFERSETQHHPAELGPRTMTSAGVTDPVQANPDGTNFQRADLEWRGTCQAESIAHNTGTISIERPSRRASGSRCGRRELTVTGVLPGAAAEDLPGIPQVFVGQQRIGRRSTPGNGT